MNESNLASLDEQSDIFSLSGNIISLWVNIFVKNIFVYLWKYIYRVEFQKSDFGVKGHMHF